ncbi:MAG: hypothetical protein ACAI25_04005 [Planctomycetota bacterium]
MTPSAILALAKTTARDGLRAPVTGVVLAFGVARTLASPEVAIFTLGDARGFVLDLGASTVLLATLFLAATTGALGTAERVQDGTALLVLTKSVSALDYVLGTFLGTAGVLAFGGWLLGLAVVHAATPGAPGSGWLDVGALVVALALGVRASRADRSFQTATFAALAVTGALALVGRIALSGLSPLALLAVLATILSVLAGCAYLALGVLLATRLPPAVAASATLGAAVLGAASSGLAATRALPFLRLVVPDLGFFSISEAAYSDELVLPLAYVASVALWTAVYSVGALALGAVLLDRRELG